MKFKVECTEKNNHYLVIKVIDPVHDSLIARCPDDETANTVADALNYYDKNVKEI